MEDRLMQEDGFRAFLERPENKLTENGVAFRMSKARKAMEYLGTDLDEVVSDDDAMYDALVELQKYEDPKHNPMQNALRKYYIFRNGREFPQLRYYKR